MRRLTTRKNIADRQSIVKDAGLKVLVQTGSKASGCLESWQFLCFYAIPDYINSSIFLQYIGTPATPAQLIARFKALPLLFTPGERWSYSNSDYDTNAPHPPQHATGYLQPHVEPVYLDMSEFYAAGALYSTVKDFYRWDQALATNRLVSAQTMASMFTVSIPCLDGGCALASDLGLGG